LQNKIYRMGADIRILCLEDQEEDFEIINYVLKNDNVQFVSKRVDTEAEYRAAIVDFSPDVILSDHSLPQFNSIDALKICLQQPRMIPFILVTGAVSEEFAVDCLKHGAEDYVLKSNLTRLSRSLRSAIKHKDLERAKQEAATMLSEQNKDLVKINGELDSFVYSVSHNLRAPLLSVLGLVNLTKYEDDLEVIRDYHKKIEHTIHDLDQTLKEILDYSRNSRQDLRLERVDLKKTILENIEKLKYMPGFDRLNVRLEIQKDCLFISDRYRLSIILNNLISNAIKYQDFSKTKSLLTIEGKIQADRVSLNFVDNGIGIATELVDKVFNMFFRATEKAEGSGLGLYIVKEAVERLHGKISVTSEVGKGSSFQIIIQNHLL
jgi:signal transduction histidine kinase